jgi:O-antigen ligase
MSLISAQKSNIKNYFNFLLALMPLSFIAGNLIINYNIIILILSTIVIYKKEVFKQQYFFLDKIIILFFTFILIFGPINDIMAFINDAPQKDFTTTLKSFLFLKYLFLYFSVRFLVEKKIIYIKFFFISSCFCSVFVCFDIFYQFIYGKDIFGYEIVGNGRRLSGPFGDELIAGGYIQRFSIFSFFLIPLFYNHYSRSLLKYFLPLIFLIFFTGLILSGNRMPMILFIFTVFLIFVFHKQVRKYLLYFVIIFSIIFSSFYNFSSNVKRSSNNFYGQISKMVTIIINKDFDNKNSPQYFKEFSSFYETWLLNKYTGGGIKSFRYHCHLRKNIPEDSSFICNMHPHNYYLEILTELGAFGFAIVLILLYNVLHISFFKKYFSKSTLKENNIIIPFIFLLIVEIFPLKSTGSFFTTGNTTYFFLLISILVGLIREHNSIENKN